MAKKEKNLAHNYLETKVGIYKKATKGFYRDSYMSLKEVLSHSGWDPAVIKYRQSITPELPKGDSALKKNIRAYTPSGDYGRNNSRSASSPLVTCTNLVQLDFDQELISDLRLKKLFTTHKFIAAASRSASGKKFYLLVLTPGPEHYGEYFEALSKFFAAKEGLTVDSSVSSINEIRFVGLSSESVVRDKAEVWTERVIREKTPIERVTLPMDGNVVKVPDDQEPMHHDDVTRWAGIQNSNGVPLQRAKDEFPVDKLDKGDKKLKREPTSMLNKAARDQQIESIYEKYADQHGVAVVTSAILAGNDMDLPTLIFPKDNTLDRNSQIIVDAVCSKYLFKTDYFTDQTYRFIGTHWVPIEDFEVKNFLMEAAMKLGFNRNRARLPEFRTLMATDLKDRTYCKFTTPSTAFNLLNGVLTFEAGEVTLRDHSDDFNFTYVLDYAYEPDNSTRPVFDTFINRVLPIAEVHEVLFQYIGSAFLPADVKFEKTLILLGSGANGKSTLIDLTSALFGDAVGTFRLERLTDQKEGPQEALHIYNKLFGVCSEGKTIKDVTLWKTLVSKEKILIKSLYKDFITSSNYGRLITCMNEAPNIDGIAGSMRRIIVIGMRVQIPNSEQDMQLGTKLRGERAAILNLIVKGYREIFAQKGVMVNSEASERDTIEVIDEQDLILNFVKEKQYYPIARIDEKQTMGRDEKYAELFQGRKPLPGKVLFVDYSALYKEYREWCHDEGHDYPFKKLKFLARFRELTLTRLAWERHRYMNETFQELRDQTGKKLFIIGVFTSHAPSNDEATNDKGKGKKDKTPF